MLCEGYVINRSKHMPNDIYLYLERQFEKFKKSNWHESVRTQNMSMQKISDLRGCSTDEIESKRVNVD